MRGTRYAGVGCAIIFLFAWILTWPFAELGANDDFSYVKNAFDLARTGHFHYNGWESIFLGVQAYWGAGVAKIFGYTFFALRISLLPAAVAGCLLIYRIARRCELPGDFAALIALSVSLCPLYLFCATTFASDVTSLLCLLLCAHLSVLAILQNEQRLGRATMLLIFACVIGFAGGTIRQTVWGMPLLAVVYAGWQWRSRRAMPLFCGIVFLALIAGIGKCIVWHNAQPYALSDALSVAVKLWIAALPGSLAPLVPLLMTCVLLMLPVALAIAPSLQRMLSPLGRVGAASIAVLVILPLSLLSLRALAPWLDNIVTISGINSGLDAIGTDPETLPMAVWILLSLASFAAAAAIVLAIVMRFRKPSVAEDKIANRYSIHFFRIGFVYCIAYILLIWIRSTVAGAIDRYTLPVLPFFAMGIGVLAGRHQPRVWKPAWGLLLLFAYFSIASVHDYYAMLRARLAMTSLLESRGIPRTQITAGMAYDGWTQLQISGYINDVRILNPPGAYHPHPRIVRGDETAYWFGEWTPAVDPKYFVVNSLRSDLQTMDIAPQEYLTWLPPFRREIFAQQK